jgi:branched-chain amino acid transport system permease protein
VSDSSVTNSLADSRPRRWNSYARSAAGELAGAAIIAALLVVIAVVGRPMLGTGVMTNMLITAVAVIGLQVFSGNGGIISFGHAGFVALGAYVSSILTMPTAMKATVLPNIPAWVSGIQLSLVGALIATIVVVGVLALIVGAVIVRLTGYAAAIASLGVLVIVHAVLLGFPDITRGAQTFYGIAPLTTFPVALLAAVGAAVVGRIFRGSRAGLQLRAAREDELAANSFGVNVWLRRLQAWTLAAMLAALAGALLAHFITAFSPKQFYFTLTFSYIVMLIIGGPATVTGAIVGTGVVMALNEALRQLESGFAVGSVVIGPMFGATQLLLAVLMLLVMYFRRDGLVGLREPDELVVGWIRRRQSPASENDPTSVNVGAAR